MLVQEDFIGPKEEFTLMCFPFEVNAISKEYSSTALSFEVSCGTFGNSVDGKVQTQGTYPYQYLHSIAVLLFSLNFY